MKTLLQKFDAVPEFVKWAGDRTLEQGWAECPNGAWMLWLAAHCAERKLVVQTACNLAHTVMRYIPENEERPWRAIMAARAWCVGVASDEDLQQAIDDASDATADAFREILDAEDHAGQYADAACTVAMLAAYTANLELPATRAWNAYDLVTYVAKASRSIYSLDQSLQQSADLVRDTIKVKDLRC